MADTPTTSIAPDLTSRDKAAEKEVDMTQVAANAEKKAPKPKKEPKQKPAQQPKQQQKKKADDSSALIGITTAKEDDLADWYQQVLLKGEMMDYSDIPGCYILLPASYFLWEKIRDFFDARIKKMGVRNCYFPIFISEKSLATEKEHLEGFEAEVAWVTMGGKDKLADRLAVRPTSETAMYPFYAKKIRSHRDLPLRLNQWNNVVRWEFKHAMPFLRSREFLWQEGHTAHLTQEAAGKEVLEILDHYADIYQELLAVPVVKGTKTDNEKFAGADYTTTVEGFIPATGRGIQGGTSHCLGQHFSKMFNISVEDPSSKEGEEKKPPLYVWQNSWGFTTRSIGVMILIHGDKKGLIIPPRVAEIQVIIVAVGITAKTTDDERKTFYNKCDEFKEDLAKVGVRAETDLREGYSPGYKFNDWELKGVPLRIEFGPKDLQNNVVTAARRDKEGAEGKTTIPITDLTTAIPDLLETIQSDMFHKADSEFRTHRVQIDKWEDFVPALNAKNVCLIRHCLGGKCEDEVKELSKRTAIGDDLAEDAKAPSMGAKSLCIPFEQPEGIVEGETMCTRPGCGAKARKWVLFGRSY